MEILLHIGQSKTGTSAIQSFLTLNRRRLAAGGVLFPAVRVGGVPVDLGSHNALADAIAGKRSYPFLTAADYAAQLFGRQATGRMILSGEHFFGGEPRIWDVAGEDAYFAGYRDKVRRVARFFSGHELRILLYLRPQVDWLESTVSQTIRIQGLTKRGVYRSDRQFFELVRPLLRYGRLLDIWQEELPHTPIVAVPYVRRQLLDGDSIGDFLQRAGIDAGALGLGKTRLSVNESISREFIEVKKRLNRTRHSSVREHAIIACLLRLSQHRRSGTRYTLPAGIVAEATALAEAENATVNARYVPEGMWLDAVGNDEAPPPPPTPAQVGAATAAFRAEFARPRYRIMELDYSLRAALRRRARPVHGLLHQLKRLSRAAAYRRT